MNYRHIYHAGNFADVLKHAVLALIIEHLKRKDPPFRVVDTHAGAGEYDLASEEAQKTGEWRDGIGRILGATLPQGVAEILEPYLAVVRVQNESQNGIATGSPNPDENTDQRADGHDTATVRSYPGSPLIARRLMRRGDRLVVNEPHPEDEARLKALFAKDPATKTLALDGWIALKAMLPPKERRGVVLIDPPFEEPGEFRRIAAGLEAAYRRFATGTFVIWYPIKDTRHANAFRRDVIALGIPKLLSVELFVRTPYPDAELSATGLLIVNPPFTLEAKLAVLLPFLARALARGGGAEGRCDWLVGDRVENS